MSPTSPDFNRELLDILQPDEFDSWCAVLVLEAWRGFQSRMGPYNAPDENQVSDGSVRLRIEAPTEKEPPSAAQIAAVRWVLEHQEQVRDVVLGRVFESYPEWRDMVDWTPADREEFVPDIETPNELKSLIGLTFLHITNVVQDDVAYFGLEFGCNWEEEHGLGVMMHKNRIVDIGGADTSFLDWIAKRDAGVADDDTQ